MIPSGVAGSAMVRPPYFKCFFAVSALQMRQMSIDSGFGRSASRSSIFARAFASTSVARSRASAVSAPSGSSLMHASGPVSMWFDLSTSFGFAPSELWRRVSGRQTR